ncbi:hypothetical protein FACS1894184_15300 [Clostridia bacterium]|nr:hypothetical protein FACS1894184_15300 [Clostridia bacterium]
MNDRKELAWEFGNRVGMAPVYDKHKQCYVVKHIKFMRHGLIEGLLNMGDVNMLVRNIHDWAIA